MQSIQPMKRALNRVVADLNSLIDFHDAVRLDDHQKQALGTISQYAWEWLGESEFMYDHFFW